MTNALIDNFLWCTLQVTLLVVAGAVLYLLLQRHASLRSGLPQWCLAMVVVLSLLVVSPWPCWAWLGQSLSEESQGALTVFLDPLPELDNAQISSLENHGFQFKAQPSKEKPLAVDSIPPPSVATTIPTRFLIPWKREFLLLASVSCLLATVRLFFAWRELRKRMRTSVLIEDTQLQEEFSTLHQQYGLSRPVALRESPHDDIPATIGWRRPSILLPPSWREWTPEQRRAVLAHELAHIEHHDFATWLAAQIPLLLHSYHPLVHWFARQLRWEQEISADRRAIKVLGDREGYLAALAELALKPAKVHRARHEYALAPSSSMLLRRLQMLRQNRSDKTPSAPRFLRGLLLTSLCAVLLGVSGLRAQAPKNKAVGQLANVNSTATITAMVMISPPPAYDADKNAEIFWETQLSLIQSQFILKSVLEQPQVADTKLVHSQKDFVVWLRKELQVSRIPDSPVLRFEFNCPTEEATTGMKIIDALTKVYQQEIKHHNIHRSNASDEKLKKLTKLHGELSNELRKKIERYQSLAEETGGTQSPTATAVLNMLINEIRMIKSQIIEKKQEVIDINVTRAIVEQQASNTHALEQAVMAQLAKDPMIANYKAEEFAYLQQILQLKANSESGTSATIKRLKAALSQLQKEAEWYRKETEIEIRKALKSAPNDLLESMLIEFRLRRDSITAQIKKLETKYTEKVKEIERKGVSSGKLSILGSEIEQLQKVESEMEYKLRSWSIDGQPSRQKAIILMPATVTSSPMVSE